MFELTWWCVLISAVLGAAVWLDARGRPPVWRLPAWAWIAAVVVTWIAVVPYVIARVTSPASTAVR